jgi:hypothetical protein
MTESQTAPVSALPAGYAVTVLPGLAALLLGLLYGVGALIKTAQLRQADVSVLDALPLVPLEQVLGLGIGTVTTSLLLLVAWALLVGTYLFITRQRPVSKIIIGRRLRQRRPTERGKHEDRLFFWSHVFVLIVFFLATTIFYFALIGGGYVLSVVLGRKSDANALSRRSVVLALATYFAVVLSALTANAYLYPSPLPTVELKMRNGGDSVRGNLIVVTGSSWYVTGERETFRSIPTNRVNSSLIRSGERQHARTSGAVLREWAQAAVKWARDALAWL